jgi:hypothetical protein
MSNFLFSTNALLSFILSERYYGGKHFVWCSQFFDERSESGSLAPRPASSTPKEIYRRLAMEVEQEDKHGENIRRIRSGLRKGARLRLDGGVISMKEFVDIRDIISGASFSAFQPLLYVISYRSVCTNLIEVPVNKRANPLYPEYQLTQLERKDFETVELPRIKI